MAISTALPSDATRSMHLLTCWAGILGSLSLYAVLQERIMAEPFGKGHDMFKFSLFLVLCNRCITCIVAICFQLVKGETLGAIAPLPYYALVAVSNVVATTCQYEALKHVSLPVQTLGKTAKMLPVMIWGSLMLGKKYTARQYSCAAFIMLGCFLFLITGSIKPHRHTNDSSALYGICLMTCYLAFDGFTSTFQDKLFRGFAMSSAHQSLYTTMFSIGISFLGLLWTNQLIPAIEFLRRHPEAISSVLFLSISATSGQFLIVHTIRQFGALVFATIMTTRQFISILLSSILFQHSLHPGQWVGATLVFSVLYFELFQKRLTRSNVAEADSAGSNR